MPNNADIWETLRRIQPAQLSFLCVSIAIILAVALSHLFWFWHTGAIPDGLTVVAGGAAAVVSLPMVQVFVLAVYRLDDSNQRLLSTKNKLNMKNIELAKAHGALSELNQQLEFRVAERTAKLEEALGEAETANKTKTVFLANMSHELRTPLNGIIGYADMIKNRKALLLDIADEKIDEYAEAIFASGQHLNAMVGDLLDLAKIECEEFEFDLTPQNINSLVGEVITELTATAETREQTILVNFTSSEITLFTDRRALHQILSNLLSNALKYSSNGQQVRIDVSSDGSETTLSVVDSGIGMSAEDIVKATKPFSRFSDAHIASGQSVGLGLSIASRFCKLLGGTLSFSSAVGAGTTVRVSFPASSAAWDGDTALALAS